MNMDYAYVTHEVCPSYIHWLKSRLERPHFPQNLLHKFRPELNRSSKVTIRAKGHLTWNLRVNNTFLYGQSYHHSMWSNGTKSIMMTSSNGNIFRVTGPLCGESPVPVNFPHKGQWRGALMFSLISAWINGWVNNGEAGDLRRHRGHYDVNVMWLSARL